MPKRKSKGRVQEDYIPGCDCESHSAGAMGGRHPGMGMPPPGMGRGGGMEMMGMNPFGPHDMGPGGSGGPAFVTDPMAGPPWGRVGMYGGHAPDMGFGDHPGARIPMGGPGNGMFGDMGGGMNQFDDFGGAEPFGTFGGPNEMDGGMGGHGMGDGMPRRRRREF